MERYSIIEEKESGREGKDRGKGGKGKKREAKKVTGSGSDIIKGDSGVWNRCSVTGRGVLIKWARIRVLMTWWWYGGGGDDVGR